MLFLAATSPRSGVVVDKDNLTALIHEWPEILNRVARKAADDLEGRILDKMKEQDPSWKPLAASTIRKKGSTKAWIDTGNLINVIESRIERGGTQRFIRVGIFNHEMGYIALCLEFGTRAYDIYPRSKKALAWKDRKGSKHKTGPFKRVHHPGIPARPLFRLVIDTEKDKIFQEIIDNLNKEIDKFRL